MENIGSTHIIWSLIIIASSYVIYVIYTDWKQKDNKNSKDVIKDVKYIKYIIDSIHVL